MINAKKEKLLIVGSGGLGRVTIEHAMKNYECSFVDDAYEIGTVICGSVVVGKIADLHKLFDEYNNVVIAIGDNTIREKLYFEAKRIGYSFPNIIGSNVYVSPYASIGEGNIILNNVSIQNGSVVGNGTILNHGVEIHHDSEVGDFVCVYTNSVIRTYAKIKKCVKLGSNVTICNEVIVDEDIIIDDGETIKK